MQAATPLKQVLCMVLVFLGIMVAINNTVPAASTSTPSVLQNAGWKMEPEATNSVEVTMNGSTTIPPPSSSTTASGSGDGATSPPLPSRRSNSSADDIALMSGGSDIRVVDEDSSGVSTTRNFEFDKRWHVEGVDTAKITRCLRDANFNKWLFTGTSHTRNVFESLGAALSPHGIGKKASKTVNTLRQYDDKRISILAAMNPFLQESVSHLTKMINADVAVIGRFFWDLDRNNTFPHDFYTQLVAQLTGARDAFAHNKKERGKIIFHMPYGIRRPIPTELPRYQCRRRQRVDMYRRLARCAVHYVNHHWQSTNNVSAPRIDLFDVFEFSQTIPRSRVDKAGHHYHPAVVDVMVAQMLERHICPGRNISGSGGFNKPGAMQYDVDPWQGVEEDCAKIFSAAASNHSNVLTYGPIGDGVYEGQRNAPPNVYDRDNIHMYRNYTPINATTGEFTLNQFRLQPHPMKPIDKLYQDTFDRTVTTCACLRDGNVYVLTDHCRMDKVVKDTMEVTNYLCQARATQKQGLIKDAIPTYIKLDVMTAGHWEEAYQVAVLKKHVSVDPVAFVQMCHFNLGARLEDLASTEQLERIKAPLRSKKNAAPLDEADMLQFACQCSGVFAPHLLALKATNITQFDALRVAFCDRYWQSLKEKMTSGDAKTVQRGYSWCQKTLL